MQDPSSKNISLRLFDNYILIDIYGLMGLDFLNIWGGGKIDFTEDKVLNSPN